VFARRAREVIDFLSQAGDRGARQPRQLRVRARVTVERQRATGTEGGCVLGSLVAQFSERDKVARTEIAEGFDAWIGGLADGLRRIQAAGEIGPRADPEELATGLMAAFQGGYTLAQASRPIAPMETALFSMIDHIESSAPRATGPPPVEHLDCAFSHGGVVRSPLPWRGQRHPDADRDSLGDPRRRGPSRPRPWKGTATAAVTRSTRGRVR
jgi:Tetracyclin repressor-like, C-terminal domain